MTLTSADRTEITDLIQREIRGADLNVLIRQLQGIGLSYAESTATYTTTVVTFGDINPGMPRLDLKPGRYLLLYGFQGGSGALASPNGCGVVAADVISAVAADLGTGQNSNVARGTVRTLTAGTLVLMAHGTGGAGTATFSAPWMAALRMAT